MHFKSVSPLLILKLQQFGTAIGLAVIVTVLILMASLFIEARLPDEPLSAIPLPTVLETDTVQAAGDITVTRTASLVTVNQHPTLPNNRVVYDIFIQNGATTYQGPMTLTDIIPAGSHCIDITDLSGRFWERSNSRCQRQKIALFRLRDANQLRAGETVHLRYVVVPTTTNGALLANTPITFVGGTPAIDMTYTPNTPAVTVKAPEWQLSKTASAATVKRGDLLTFQITARNVGAIQTSGTFTIRDVLPANTTFVSVGASSRTPVSVTPTATDVSWVFNDVLNPRDSVQLSFTVRVNNSVNNGDFITNQTYTVSGGYLPGQTAGKPVAVPVNAPVTVDIRKSGPSTVNAGDTMRYQFTLTNDAVSQSTVRGIFVADTLPTGVIGTKIGYVSGNRPEDTAYFNGRVAIWEIKHTLGINDKVVMFVEVKVDGNLADGTALVNSKYQLFPLPGTPFFDVTPKPVIPVTTTVNGPALLTISKNSSTTIARINDIITYTIRVENRSNRTATSVVVQDAIPVNTTFHAARSDNRWSCSDAAPAGTNCTLSLGSLAGKGVAQVVFAVRVNPIVSPKAAQVQNTAQVNYSSSPPPPTPLTNNTATANLIRVDVPGVLLEPESQTRFGEPGTMVTYPLTVTNTGNAPDTITLTVTRGAFPASLSNTVLNMGAFESRAIQVNVTIPTTATLSQADTTGVEAQSTKAPTVIDDARQVTIVSRAPDLAVIKGPTDAQVRPGGIITYGIFYINRSTITAQGIVLTETLPAFTTYIGDPFLWKRIGNTSQYRFEAGQLPANNARPIEFLVRVNDNAPLNTVLINTVEVGDNGLLGTDPVLTNNKHTVSTRVTNAPIANQPDLLLRKDDRGVSPQAGQPIRYDLSFSNRGGAVARGVVITETVPAHTTADVNASLPTVWTCPNGVTAGNICTHAVGDVAAGAFNQATQFVVVVDKALPSNVTQVQNRAVMANRGRTTVVSATETTTINRPNAATLTLSKSDNGVTAKPGDTVIYTLQYANTGSGVSSGVVLSEVVPANSTFNAAASSTGWGCNGNGQGSICTYAAGTLPGNSGLKMLRFAVTVNRSLPAQVDSLGNVATIEDGQGNKVAAIDITPLNNVPSSSGPIFLPIILHEEAPPADLRVADVQVSNRTPTTGQEIELKVIIENSGRTSALKDFWVDLYLARERITPRPGQSWEDKGFGISRVPYGVVWRVYGLRTGERRSLSNLIPNDPFNLDKNYSNFIPANIGNWDKTWRGIPLTNSFHRPGRYYLYVQVDSLQNIAEANEVNNVFGPITIDVTGPALPFEPSSVTALRLLETGQRRLTVQP